MDQNLEKIKRLIPNNYHFLLNQRLFITSEMKDDYRVKKLNGLEFNRCEKCRYDLLTSSAYKSLNGGKKSYPYRGYVHYYDNYKLILCDCCVDELNGQPWNELGYINGF